MKLRPEEEWVRQVLESCLKLRVEQHDDGSRSHMHDLTILLSDGRVSAVEVTAAADGESIALWRLLNDGDRWIDKSLRGGWMAELLPTARAKRVRRELPALLRDLEENEVRSLRGRNTAIAHLKARALDLGVTSLMQGETDFPGSIYITIDLPSDRSGGAVPATGDPLALWVGGFLQDGDRADVRRKLALSNADDRHVVVLVPGFSPAPFGVTDLLMRDDAPLPDLPPDLPEEITHVWMLSTWTSGKVFSWSSSSGWHRYAKVR